MTLVLQWHLFHLVIDCARWISRKWNNAMVIFLVYEKLPLILGPQGFLKASRKWSDDGDFGRADVGHSFTLFSLKYISYECASMHWINDPVTDVTMMVYSTIIIKTGNCVHFCTKMTLSWQLHFNSIPHTLPVVILNTNENVKEGEKGYKFIPFSPYIYSQNVPTKITF